VENPRFGNGESTENRKRLWAGVENSGQRARKSHPDAKPIHSGLEKKRAEQGREVQNRPKSPPECLTVAKTARYADNSAKKPLPP
jgi:hypothetical protein